MTSTRSTSDLTQFSAVSPPPYTPTATDVTSLSWQPFDDKCAPGSEEAMINRIIQSKNQQLCVPNGTSFQGSASRPSSRSTIGDDLPEVVPDTFPEVATSSLPEVAPCALPQVALSSAPQVTSPVPEDGLEVAANGNKMDVSTVSGYPVPTVTPLHLLGDQPEQIDCPFCLQQTMTRVKKKPSNFTHIQAVFLLMTTVCGAVAPYIGSWSYDLEHYCAHCANRVAYRARGKEIYLCKQPDSAKEASKYAIINLSEQGA
ncbi:hypothetical protein B0T10DRAFT_558929 [Thelonectria olida]|uniref:LITAF domain-containing protein n=1 Tax=Thelonectria olida TaxID=1576542 RepID=A0A9P8WB35_9HYPO|nr:hypothetical protein B0T10DRAFT_558929 [Thelonectria olida]